MKSYTDLKQSKKLAEILPIESADMNWHELPSTGLFVRAFSYKRDNGATEGLYPCWSLTALLGVLPYTSLHKTFIGWRCDSYNKEVTSCILGDTSDNPIDACYEMIIKLYELNLL